MATSDPENLRRRADELMQAGLDARRAGDPKLGTILKEAAHHADAMLAAAKAAVSRGERGTALDLISHANMLDEVCNQLLGLPKSAMPLPERDHADTVGHMTGLAHHLATSQGKGARDPAFTAARIEKKLTLDDLAQKVGMSLSALKMARSGKRPIREAFAKKIERAIGFEATAANWPGGIIP